ncbi:MAG: hypothetical protein AAF551_14890 [Bacteroidota bacterium]
MTRIVLFLYLASFTFVFALSAQTSIGLLDGLDGLHTTNLAGVYQGKTLFIQNPYNPQTGDYCVVAVAINNQRLTMNYRLSAIKLDFDKYELYSPVNITVYHADTVCQPVIINSEAVLFHTIFRFSEINLTDSALTWSTKGERGIGSFEVEKLEEGFWKKLQKMDATGAYEGAGYSFFPQMDDGHNKYRVRYNYPSGSRKSYLYSMEMDFDYYPEPVEFKPRSASTKLFLSRATSYEIYDAKGELALQGQGNVVDVTLLGQGKYVIYFNGKDPGTFNKQ